MTIRKTLIIESGKAELCGYRWRNRWHYKCKHPECPDSEGVCGAGIALWCPLQDADQEETPKEG